MDNLDLHVIEQYIMQQSGLYFKEHSLKGLRRVVNRKMGAAGCATAEEYLRFLMFHPGGEDAFRELLNEITVKHTFFFRNKPQFKVLTDKVLPELQQEKRLNGSRSIRLLSAGCATGEEAYSLAITLLETVADPANWNLEVVAADISTTALKASRKGVYTKRALRHVDTPRLQKYFNKETARDGIRDDTRYRVAAEVRNIVRVEHLNLSEERFPRGFDVVFCRNVLIYFSRDSIAGVIRRLNESLNPGGYLFLGHSESLLGRSKTFELIDVPAAAVYRKVTAASIAVPAVSADTSAADTSLPPGSYLPADPVVLFTAVKPASELSSFEVTPGRPRTGESPSVDDRSALDTFLDARACFELKQYPEALRLCRRAVELDRSLDEAHVLEMNILANTGLVDESIEKALYIIDRFPTAPGLHFMLGILYFRNGQASRAREAFKKEIYLDPGSALAYMNLAGVCRRENKAQEAGRNLKNAIKALEERPRDEVVELSGGFTVGLLMDMCIKTMADMPGVATTVRSA